MVYIGNARKAYIHRNHARQENVCKSSNHSSRIENSEQLSPLRMARQWILTGQEGFETSLQYEENIPIPPADKLGPNEVLVEMHAASLNYRELIIAGPVVSRPCLSRCSRSVLTSCRALTAPSLHLSFQLVMALVS
jgi:hypothetical protein